jgi:hypothetical protein
MTAEARFLVIEASDVVALWAFEEAAQHGPALRFEIVSKGGDIDAVDARSEVVAGQLVPPHAAFS